MKTFISFPDYSESELLEIISYIAKEKGYKINVDSMPLIKNTLARISEFKKPTFGNGRSMRNLFEIAVKKQAVRLLSYPERNLSDLSLLTHEDFEIDDSQLEKL